MMMNALNGFWLDTYMVQILIQKELERLASYMERNYN